MENFMELYEYVDLCQTISLGELIYNKDFQIVDSWDKFFIKRHSKVVMNESPMLHSHFQLDDKYYIKMPGDGMYN